MWTDCTNLWEINLIFNAFASINEICKLEKYLTKIRNLDKSHETFIAKHRNNILCTHKHLDPTVSLHQYANNWALISAKCGSQWDTCASVVA